jgi:hypothetical protein
MMGAITEQMRQMCYAQWRLPNLFCSQFVVIINMCANVILNHNQQKSLIHFLNCSKMYVEKQLPYTGWAT